MCIDLNRRDSEAAKSLSHMDLIFRPAVNPRYYVRFEARCQQEAYFSNGIFY